MGILDKVAEVEKAKTEGIGGMQYKQGYDDGFNAGYDKGYQEGYRVASKKFKPKDFYDPLGDEE